MSDHLVPEKCGPLNFLIVEDDDTDASLILHHLARGSYEVNYERVQTAASLMDALAKSRFDVVLSDFGLPSFTGLEATKIVKHHDPYLPVILVTGTIGDEMAIEALKIGVDDYVLKGNLARLWPAIEQQLGKYQGRRSLAAAQEALKESEQRFRQLAENINDFFYLTDADNSRMLYASPAFERIWGRGVQALYENPRVWAEALHPEDRPYAGDRIGQIVQGKTEATYRIVRPDGSVRWLRSRGFPICNESGKVVRIAGIVEDETERREAEEQIRRLNRVHAMLSGINSVLVRTSSREELFREACRIAVEDGRFQKAWIGIIDGDPPSLKVAGSHGGPAEFFETVVANVNSRISRGQGLIAQLLLDRRPVVANELERDTRVTDGHELLALGSRALVALPLVVSGAVKGVLILHAEAAGFFDSAEMRLLRELADDISFGLDHIEKAARLDYLAYYDPLTGLANRALFLERLSQSIHEAAMHREKLAVMLINVDRFKNINDTFGRHAGDALLRQIAERFHRTPGEQIRHARLAADTFGLVTPAMTTDQDVARRMQAKLVAYFGRPFEIADTDLNVSAKVGVAMFPHDGADADELFRKAELALKRAKNLGEAYVFYTEQMSARVAENLTLENKLRRALERDEFVLHYQPKMNATSGVIEGVEALIRWQTTDMGLVPPAQFIPLLEETGLILQVGAWALRRAVSAHSRWREIDPAAPRIAVNISAIQLRQRDFVDSVRRAIEKGGPAPGIDLEITESTVMATVEENVANLRAVREMGLGVAIDDFGTGYSSLGYLAKLPVDSLKIDRSFVITMLTEPAAMTLVSTIITLAHSLKLKVIAEGVDDEEQAKVLRLLHCDELQGYLFSPPLPEEDLWGRVLQRRLLS